MDNGSESTTVQVPEPTEPQVSADPSVPAVAMHASPDTQASLDTSALAIATATGTSEATVPAPAVSPVKKKSGNPRGRKSGRKPASHFHAGYTYKLNSTAKDGSIKYLVCTQKAKDGEKCKARAKLVDGVYETKNTSHICESSTLPEEVKKFEDFLKVQAKTGLGTGRQIHEKAASLYQRAGVSKPYNDTMARKLRRWRHCATREENKLCQARRVVEVETPKAPET